MKKFIIFVFKDWPIKIICLFISLGIWIYVGSSQAQIGNFPGKIPLELKNSPEGLMAVMDVDSVSVKIVAASNVWKKLAADSFSAWVDLDGLEEGTYDVPIEVSSKVEEVQVVEINPAKIFIRLEKIDQKEVPIILQVEGKPADGFVVGDWKIKPARVNVAGATSVVSKIMEATAKVYLSGEKDTIQRIARVVALDSNSNEIKNLTFNPPEVEVELPLVQASSAKTVGIKVTTIGQPAQGYWVSQIETIPSSVAITASASLISQISFIETKEIDINGINKPKEYTTPLKPNTGVTILDEINLVKVKVVVAPLSTTRQFQTGFSWKNLNPNLKVVSSDPSAVTVVLSGSTFELSNITAKDITINLDLGQYNYAGTYSIDISRDDFVLPSGISFSSVVPSAINVRLEAK